MLWNGCIARYTVDQMKIGEYFINFACVSCWHRSTHTSSEAFVGIGVVVFVFVVVLAKTSFSLTEKLLDFVAGETSAGGSVLICIVICNTKPAND